jgi:hypothetical protein
MRYQAEEKHYVTVKELINDLQATEGSDVHKFMPDAKVVITTADKEFTILSIYDNEGTVWIDVEEEE